MATKIEKLSEEIINNIQTLQGEVRNYIFDLGQVSMRYRELNQQLDLLESFKKEVEEKIDNRSLQLENILSDLQKKYKNAEIDLSEGTVSFEVSE